MARRATCGKPSNLYAFKRVCVSGTDLIALLLHQAGHPAAKQLGQCLRVASGFVQRFYHCLQGRPGLGQQFVDVILRRNVHMRLVAAKECEELRVQLDCQGIGGHLIDLSRLFGGNRHGFYQRDHP